MIEYKPNLPAGCEITGFLYLSESKEELRYDLDWLKVSLPDDCYIITGWFEKTQTYFVDFFGPVIEYVELRPQQRKEFQTFEETITCIEEFAASACGKKSND